MPRNRTGEKRGRKTTMTPDHVAFLEPYADRFRAGTDTGTLYTEVTNAWIRNFGYDGLPENVKDPINVADLRMDENIEDLPAEEKDAVLMLRARARATIRAKIGNWFRHKYCQRRTDPVGVEEVLSSLLKISKDRPKKTSELSMYFAKYYKSKLKASFDALWDSGLQRTVPMKHRINWCRKFAHENWIKESEEVKQGIREQCEAQYTEALEKWKTRVDWSGSAEEYMSAFQNIDAVLPPFADAISKYTGLVTIVTVVGPSGADKGEIVIRNSQSVTTNDTGHQTWAQAESEAYNTYQESLFAYARSYYSEAERLARVPDSTEDNDNGGEVDAQVDAVDAEDEVAVNADTGNGSDAGEAEFAQRPSMRDSSPTSTRPPPRRRPARNQRQPADLETSMFARPAPRRLNQQSNADASTSTGRPSCGLRLPEDNDDEWAQNDSEDWQSVLEFLDNPPNPGTFLPGSMGTPFVQSRQEIPVNRMLIRRPSLLGLSASFDLYDGDRVALNAPDPSAVTRTMLFPTGFTGNMEDDDRVALNAPDPSAITRTVHFPTGFARNMDDNDRVALNAPGPSAITRTPASFADEDDRVTLNALGPSAITRTVENTTEDMPAAPPPTDSQLSHGVAPKLVDSTEETPAAHPARPPINPEPSHGLAQKVVNSTEETPACPPPTNSQLSHDVVPQDVHSTENMPAGPPAPPPINSQLSRVAAPQIVDSTEETSDGAPPSSFDSTTPPNNPIGTKKAKAKHGKSPGKRTMTTQDENNDPGASSKKRKITVSSKTANSPADGGNTTPLGIHASNGGSDEGNVHEGDQVDINQAEQIHGNDTRRSTRDRRPPSAVDKGAVPLVKKRKATKGRGKV